MNRLAKFWQATRSDKVLVCKCAITLAWMRLGLVILDFTTLQRLLTMLGRQRVRTRIAGTANDQNLVRAVRAASRFIPGATCLTQALAMKLLLNRRGWPASLRIGVTKGRGGELNAHAWLECEGRILIGNLKDLHRFTTLPPIP